MALGLLLAALERSLARLALLAARTLLPRLALGLLLAALERSLARLPLLTVELLALGGSLLSEILATLSTACARALLGEILAMSSFKTLLQWILALSNAPLLPLPHALSLWLLALASLVRRTEKLFSVRNCFFNG